MNLEHNTCGTTHEAGSNVSDGRPRGTTREVGSHVSSGRPCGTTREAGCSVSSSRPRGRRHRIEFHDSIEFPTEWDTSEELVNLDDKLLDMCT